MPPEHLCSCSEKYLREHTPSLDDLIPTRREFLLKNGMGFGALSLAAFFGLNLFESEAAPPTGPSTAPLAPRRPHFEAKAKAVIHIFAAGAPSQVDTWDPKPVLTRYNDRTIPGNDRLAFGSPFRFDKKGVSGIEVSEVFPRLGECVDDMAVIRSLWTDIPAHDVAQRMMNTGSLQIPKPSLGSWVVYGLGTLNQNMPGFITIGGAPESRQAIFLPGYYQGTEVNYSTRMNLDDVIFNIRNEFTPVERQRRQMDLVHKLNEMHAAKLQRDGQLEARIEAFEMAFRMQAEATDAFDISREPAEVRDRYGRTEPGAKLLVARRLVERGVRFVQVTLGGWDHHTQIATRLPQVARDVDQPAAALIKDLKQRGLFDSTLILWGGEFGRTVTREGRTGGAPGRDHHGRGFCAWLAGGGVKGGTVYGATDELGTRAVQNRVHVHDLHATLLALLGFDHERLTYRYNGRDFRLTDNYGHVVREIIA